MSETAGHAGRFPVSPCIHAVLKVFASFPLLAARLTRLNPSEPVHACLKRARQRIGLVRRAFIAGVCRGIRLRSYQVFGRGIRSWLGLSTPCLLPRAFCARQRPRLRKREPNFARGGTRSARVASGSEPESHANHASTLAQRGSPIARRPGATSSTDRVPGARVAN